MGEGEPLQRALRLQQHLASSYRYSTDFVGRSGQMPLESFLFDRREGHCEFFATAMVVMLRSQGIPARFVTGFYGGELNALEGYYIVRQSNAHAWVEAWVPGAGWHLFDPTPATGLPGAEERNLPMLMSQVWDYMLFRWDRYVLTFGFEDQLQLLFRARSAWLALWRMFDSPDEAAAAPDAAPVVDTAAASTAAGAEGSGWREWVPWAGALIAVLAVVAAWLIWRRRRIHRSATDAYRRLRERLQRRGDAVPASLGPIRLLRDTTARYPEAAQPAGQLVRLYLRESFAGEQLSAEELGEATRSLQEVERVLAKAG
jgi:membrane protein implicated in regulation of membrane protease activity